MDYLLSQPPLLECYSEDAQNQGQFDWSLLGTGPTLNNTDAPGTLSDNGLDPIFTPEQLATLLQTCDSPYPTDSFPQDFSTECLNQPEWNLQPFPDFTFQSLDFNNPFIPASQPPMVTDSTTYRDGFGNPIKPVDHQPTYDSSAGFETYSSPPAMPSSSYSPSDTHPGYAYPPPQPPPVVERTNHWDLLAGSNYSPSKTQLGVT
ncbi:uncharacterized protein PGTG_06579 [Puccinia graminis f. sp. tritici CRL 75-36-700-3]|uniref:Uncharacterized protein n=1 Tax=Puccinia graminis f. sp. tritici (strain CRL 75-36-700-3 / race SCCL) TaxID=418459 RepID=E3K8P2_PUCGT|nr:uncharacterized protein PGTG_06579 [Puccinia graminis f. sp. tritici CRL 75-36-700-3]EFP80623.1 hypothetical protein PGTG_06579 [Puccinia graminis f. sp. tritici CRL 75-36-700-3]